MSLMICVQCSSFVVKPVWWMILDCTQRLTGLIGPHFFSHSQHTSSLSPYVPDQFQSVLLSVQLKHARFKPCPQISFLTQTPVTLWFRDLVCLRFRETSFPLALLVTVFFLITTATNSAGGQCWCIWRLYGLVLLDLRQTCPCCCIVSCL